MITLIVGGTYGCSEVESIWPAVKNPQLLRASQSGSFKKFCSLAVESSRYIVHLDRLGKELHRVLANDDIAVHFSLEYLQRAIDRGSIMYKIATAIETALDLELDVEVIVVGEEAEEILKNRWPDYWPQRRQY